MKRALVLMFCGVLFCPLYGQAESLPKPSGKYAVGVTYLSFVDENRKEMFDSTLTSRRELTVKVWYPADTVSTPEPYLLAAEAEFATKYLQFPETYKELRTNSSRDVPVSSKEKQYPILVFSHGWGEHYSQNTILMEELASRGYVVFSVAHHYECKFSSFPDGRLIRIEMGNPRFRKMMAEQMNPTAMGLFPKLEKAANDEERARVFEEMSQTLPIILTESPTYWAQDVAFLIDRLAVMNSDEIRFKNKLNMNQIGVFGMSLGGLATSVVCSVDKRVKAGVNIDGGYYVDSLVARCQTPFMFLNSKRYLGCGTLFTGQSTRNCYSMTVKGSDHYNFSDYSVYPVPMVSFLLGPIDGKRTIQIMNVLVPAFFDKYLKEKQGIDLIEKARAYPEVEMTANLVAQK